MSSIFPYIPNDAQKFSWAAPDDGRHGDVWEGKYYDVLFRIGGQFFDGRSNIKRNARGRLFYDITDIKREAALVAYAKYSRMERASIFRREAVSTALRVLETIFPAPCASQRLTRDDGESIGQEWLFELYAAVGNSAPEIPWREFLDIPLATANPPGAPPESTADAPSGPWTGRACWRGQRNPLIKQSREKEQEECKINQRDATIENRVEIVPNVWIDAKTFCVLEILHISYGQPNANHSRDKCADQGDQMTENPSTNHGWSRVKRD